MTLGRTAFLAAIPPDAFLELVASACARRDLLEMRQRRLFRSLGRSSEAVVLLVCDQPQAVCQAAVVVEDRCQFDDGRMSWSL